MSKKTARKKRKNKVISRSQQSKLNETVRKIRRKNTRRKNTRRKNTRRMNTIKKHRGGNKKMKGGGEGCVEDKH